MTIHDALAKAQAILEAAGIQTPSLDAALLLSFVINKNKAQLITIGKETLTEYYQKTFFELVRKRSSGVCVAYITGKKEFYGLDFAVNPAVLVPRPDTEILVEAALRELEKRIEKPGTGDLQLRVLDLCTGCGAIAVALKHEMPQIEVWASDISKEALETANANAASLLPSQSICFRQGNLLEALSGNNIRFSLIISNPPYIPTQKISSLPLEVQNEPRLAIDGGSDGLDLIRDIVKNAPAFLTPGGTLLLEADPGQMKEIAELMGHTEICIYQDLSGQQRVISGTWLPDHSSFSSPLS